MESNKYITVAYKLYTIEDQERELIEEAKVEHPFQFISGLGSALESFENQTVNLKEGDTFDFTIASKDAYGDFEDDYVIELPKHIFEIEGKFDAKAVREGSIVPLTDAEGRRLNGMVVEVKDKVVIVDMNHPLAGADLNFVGQIVESRPATAEEVQGMINMMASEGCNCGCDSCGDGCDDHQSCGEHCH
ncbi:MAG: FKBP-type peptidyl-prolyl cis-trans isomerase [Mediterranea sp.]|jgi:FKBP-type peptidyl-prolyl cis-trans isomerase SlyD|nr:FKBP-type peptidyl-prolyl cis-trans isomerase [Mediterranea sp.]